MLPFSFKLYLPITFSIVPYFVKLLSAVFDFIKDPGVDLLVIYLVKLLYFVTY